MERYTELDRLLEFMEKNIDPAHMARVEKLQYDAINFHEIDRIPLTICTAPEGFRPIPLEQAYHNPEKMLYNEILSSTTHSSYNSVRMKDDSPLMIRSNHGIGIIASLFGCKSTIFNDQMPWVAHISLSEAKKAFSNGVPELDCELGRVVVETCMYYRERLKEYPRCTRWIRITQPDLQGPYDILHLIVGSEAFMLPLDDPALASHMVDVIADTYIAYRKFIDPYLNDSYGGDATFVHGYCIGGKVLLKADTGTANLSPEMYILYEGIPGMKIIRAFEDSGGGSLHYCGGPKKWHNSVIFSEKLGCLNFGNPEMHDLSHEYSCLKEKKVAIVGWGNTQEYPDVRKAFMTGDRGEPVKTGLTLMSMADDIEQGKRILDSHRALSDS
ncbi:MAG: hypothetical protein R6W99_04255 [Clostridia bacterium]